MIDRLTFSDEAKDLLNACVDLLPDQEREAILAIFYDRVGYREMAKRLGMSPRQARRVMQRAYSRLGPLMLAVEGVDDV